MSSTPATSAIAIPGRKNKQHRSSASGSSVTASSSSFTPRTPNSFASSSSSSQSNYGSPSATRGNELSSTPNTARRRESLMSATFSRAEHTVINVGDAESPRLITCVKASQGFDWNQEIFLPSYADYIFDDLERRQDPVEDIILTEEEVRNMLPQ